MINFINDTTSQSVKISIVVPFYNVETYVSQCLDSILSQDMMDFEVIAVNDGSTDTTPSLLEKYADRDCRIRVLHLKNGGLSWARNQGMAKAVGEYLLFVDGDDFILPGALSKLYNYAQTNAADVVIFSYIRWSNGTFGNVFKFSYPVNTLMSALTATKEMLLNKDVNAWNKFVRRNLYLENNISFKEKTNWEDAPVTCKILLGAKRIFYIENFLYAYVYRKSSITGLPKSAKSIEDLFCNIDIMGEQIRISKWKNELANIFDYRYICYLLRFSQRHSYEECHEEVERLKVKNILDKRLLKITFKQIIFNDYLDLRQKRNAILLKLDSYKQKRAIKDILKDKGMDFWIGKFLNSNYYDVVQKKFLEEQIKFEYLKAKKPGLIWGTSIGGEYTYKWLESINFKVIGFVDNDQTKWSKTFLNLPIYSPQSIDKKNLKTQFPYIFIGTMYVKEVEEELLKLGYKRGWEFSTASMFDV